MLLLLPLGSFFFFLALLTLFHFLLLLGALLLQSTLLEPLLTATFNTRKASIFESLLTLDLDFAIEFLLLGQVSGTSVSLQRIAELIGIGLHEGQVGLGLARALPLLAQIGQAHLFHVIPQLTLRHLLLRYMSLDLVQLNATFGALVVVELKVQNLDTVQLQLPSK